MKAIKPRKIQDLQVQAHKAESHDIAWVQGVLDACNMLDDLYSGCQAHPNLLGDCILAKLNLLSPKAKIRKNPKWQITVSE